MTHLRLPAFCFLLMIGIPAALPAAESEPLPKKVYQTRGSVREIAGDRHFARIRHEAIPGYMGAMTMEFTVLDPKELAGINVGDTVSFRLLVNDETHWIDTVRRIEAISAPVAEPGAGRTLARQVQLKVGDMMPDAELIDETGQKVSLSRLRGKAVAFTFFFTRCPIPDFCPRMNRNLSSARDLLLADANAPTNWQFLSISFDADFDQPDVLARHAKLYRGQNANQWLFAAATTNVLAALAPRLNLIVARDGGSFSHNLRTLVLDTRGRIHHQFDGNQWTANELAIAMREAAALPK